jgi:acetone carboxylase gamma subunit
MELSDITPTNSPIQLPIESPEHQSQQLQPATPDIKIFCDNYQDLLSKVVCPVCEETFTPPVVMCVSGHSFCGKCSPWMTLCTVCFQPLTDTQNRNLQNILFTTSFQCPSRPEGCPFKTQLSEIVDHHKHCEFSMIRCPVSRLEDKNCVWQGAKKDFFSHVRNHWYLVLEGSQYVDYFSICPFTPYCKFLILGDEIFAYYKFMARDRWIFLVEKAGLTSKKYKCVFRLVDANSLSHVRVTLPIRDTEGVFSEKISSGNCFRMPWNMMRNFIIDNTYMKVELCINDVTEHASP